MSTLLQEYQRDWNDKITLNEPHLLDAGSYRRKYRISTEKTHTGPEHKNHELIPFRRLVLLHYSRFGRYEVSSVVSKVKVWNPASAVTNFMESPLCRDLKTNDSDMVFSFFLERDGPWLLSNLGGFFFIIIKN